jgi:hypothetical protein
VCHISLLDSDQIEALEALPHRFKREFERYTDSLSVRDRKNTIAAFLAVMDSAGKSGERVWDARHRKGYSTIAENFEAQR